MIDPRKRHLLYLLQTRPKEGKEVSMVHLNSLKRPKVALTIYVSQETKRGLKIAAALEGKTTSQVVEQLCSLYLIDRPAVQKALREGG